MSICGGRVTEALGLDCHYDNFVSIYGGAIVNALIKSRHSAA